MIYLEPQQKEGIDAGNAPAFAISIEEAKGRLDELNRFIREVMISGTDYGLVPGCSKPTLYKSGAEKLADVFGFSRRIEITHRVENFENDFYMYEAKATLINKATGIIEAEGVGCCNSSEKKYAKEEPRNILNTLLKMAKKRAIVDAVLTATRSSGIFSQDIEEMDLKPKLAELATKKQLAMIKRLMEERDIPPEAAKKIMVKRYRVNSSNELTIDQASGLIDALKNLEM